MGSLLYCNGHGDENHNYEKALIIHAIAAPIIFIGISLIYFNFFNYTTPLETAIIFMVCYHNGHNCSCLINKQKF